MPRAKTGSGARCVKHGTDCAIGGGSTYRSAHCSRAPRPTEWDTAASDQPDPELVELLTERRAAATGVPLTEAADALAVELSAGAKAWAKLTPVQRCEARDGEDAELAELIETARATA
ncbi:MULTISPECIES: hypothetical protein [unclassified Modestobacter]|uniref:hypothetical protein n=1 Tax=unclassified Modestobacter TaxID=2643866 RepID=UPI0022AB4481|nr:MULTISPECIES: hypothetical protein [unclassified Modestobacter]MCZ2824186.1 hypothetical protein [Modestobacter sp. VKM Ac-2981]MCZ2854286.1 hypothetical protein [Modestobacter sp. VKM Ac-2982]